MALLSTRNWSDWVDEYAQSHQHPVNRFCHSIGIPMVASSVAVAAASLFVPELWTAALWLFGVGWVFQFVGHAFEGKRPEFLRDLRFLFVGLRWWVEKTQGRI
jgi:uncharacterized membrane protein YGL010W